MRLDSAALPFVVIASVPAVLVGAIVAPLWGAALLVVPIAIALFFRDPDRTTPPGGDDVYAPADGTVMHAGPARPGEAPPGAWQQITIFLSVLDVHINRTPVGGVVTATRYVPGSFLAAFKPDSYRNEHSEIWIDSGGVPVVVRQVVGVLARRVVCRVKPNQVLVPGERIGLMKFGSRMDVFLPSSSIVLAEKGRHVTAGVTVIGRLVRGRA